MNSVSPAISVHDLKKSYDDVHAVKGIDFEIQPGEVFGLLGPNGAGKTTTVEILEGLRQRSAGEVKVLGFDPDKYAQRIAFVDAVLYLERVGAMSAAVRITTNWASAPADTPARPERSRAGSASRPSAGSSRRGHRSP